MTEPIRKLACYQPLARGQCDACGQPIVYNLAIDHVSHDDPTLDLACLTPFPAVHPEPDECLGSGMSDSRVFMLVKPRGTTQVGEVVIGCDPALRGNLGDDLVYAVLVEPEACYCGDNDPAGCMHFQTGYPWCRPCGEHHRPPECAIDEQGRALNWEGVPWEDLP